MLAFDFSTNTLCMRGKQDKHYYQQPIPSHLASPQLKLQVMVLNTTKFVLFLLCMVCAGFRCARMSQKSWALQDQSTLQPR